MSAAATRRWCAWLEGCVQEQFDGSNRVSWQAAQWTRARLLVPSSASTSQPLKRDPGAGAVMFSPPSHCRLRKPRLTT